VVVAADEVIEVRGQDVDYDTDAREDRQAVRETSPGKAGLGREEYLIVPYVDLQVVGGLGERRLSALAIGV